MVCADLKCKDTELIFCKSKDFSFLRRTLVVCEICVYVMLM